MSRTKHRALVSELFPAISEASLAASRESLHQQFSSAAAAADLRRLVAEIDAQTALVDQHVLQLTAVALKRHTAQLAATELTRARLSGAIANLGALTEVYTAAHDLGHSLTAKIRALDQEIGNVDRTLRFVAEAQLLRNNISQTHYAVAKRDWEQAARCIHTIKYRLSAAMVDGQFARAVIPLAEIPALPAAQVQEWVALVTAEAQALFNDAARRRLVPEITRYFQIFPQVGEPETGLTCYLRFICSIISDTSRLLIALAALAEPRHGLYASVVASLFESVSTMLSQHTPLITRYYAEAYPAAVGYVVTRIQKEIDAQICTIVDTFWDAARVPKTLTEIGLHQFAYLQLRCADTAELEDVADTDLASIVDVGDIVAELAAIMHHWSLYGKFVAVKYFAAGPAESPLRQPDLLAASNFTKKLKAKYLPAFDALAAFYLRRSLEKAISIEELPDATPYLRLLPGFRAPDQAPTSSVIEDVTLVFNTIFRHVLDAAQLSAVRLFVADTFKTVSGDLLRFLMKALADNLPRYNNYLVLDLAPGAQAQTRAGTPAPESVSGFFKGASSAFNAVAGLAPTANNNAKLMQYIFYLNTVATGQEFIEQIVANVTTKNPAYMKGNFPFGIEEEQATRLVKEELLEPYVSAIRGITRPALLNFFNQCIKNRVAALVADCFPETESQYMVHLSASLADPATQIRFKLAWDLLVKPYRQVLHKALLYDKLLRLVVVNTASMIEKRLVAVLKRFKINELGALKLDKDLSFMIDEICEDDYELKEKFLRVTQMVMLVGMDNEEYEMSGHHGDDDEGINWVLTPLERKLIRLLRV